MDFIGNQGNVGVGAYHGMGADAVGDPGGRYGSVSVETGWCFPFVLVGVRACVRFWVGSSCRLRCRSWWGLGIGFGRISIKFSGLNLVSREVFKALAG